MSQNNEVVALLRSLVARVASLEDALRKHEERSQRRYTHITEPEAPDVLSAVCDVTNVRIEDIRAGRRYKHLQPPKRAAAHMLRARGWPVSQIGHALGYKDRTGAMWHLRKPPPNDIIRQAEKLLARTG